MCTRGGATSQGESLGTRLSNCYTNVYMYMYMHLHVHAREVAERLEVKVQDNILQWTVYMYTCLCSSTLDAFRVPWGYEFVLETTITTALSHVYKLALSLDCHNRI